MNNYHYIYVAFLIIVGIGALSLTMDFEDKGSCAMSGSGDIRVRQPGTDNYVEKPFCIIINT